MNDIANYETCQHNGIQIENTSSKTLLLEDNVQFNVYDWGKGIPILFIHGFPFDSSMWHQAASVLLQKQNDDAQTFLQYRTIMPDLRGMGKNTLPNTSRTPTQHGIEIDKYADDLNEILDKLEVKEPVVVVGLSMGGYIAMQFVHKYSERVNGLVLCNTKTTPDPDDAKAKRFELIDNITASRDNASQVLEGVADSMIPKLFAALTYSDKPEVVDKVRSMITSNNPQGISAAAWGMATREDTTQFLSNAQCLVLVIGGDEDKFTPPSAMKQLADVAIIGKYVEIPNAGHLPPMEQPELFAIALNNFIKELNI
jgi:pimeloyl-ACP methyl ester carboxylesterase